MELMTKLKEVSDKLAGFLAKQKFNEETPEAAAAPETPETAPETTPASLTFEGTLNIGDEAKAGEAIAADGEYILDNGNTVTVKDGKVEAIAEPAPAEAATDAIKIELAAVKESFKALEAKQAELIANHTKHVQAMELMAENSHKALQVIEAFQKQEPEPQLSKLGLHKQEQRQAKDDALAALSQKIKNLNK